ncbi:MULTISPECIES: MerR family transcriptional regulator [Pseudonocardia]|uniref:HTH-type transcriptional activator TipA n=2 Tax=Pseudonocardia TaxID=1847 RepID=A0A1Y2N3Q4_PSEAH|nr:MULTISPECIES: MerR family transcriptional regulator [Pseudonocardia]OSY41779.1 HTH-type transcriptional activator TipA [Pseudonocardia autotrophica]TDN71169.1 DNA-binding transcriptional MerR regulator [Pseudonocardia autotrophica]BBG01839.1 HTH-type transcriptional activator TipA [Pseudonocardia autotrophica]GEC23005.1 HTH-type transcriptional activator TipA [Pseudonocardia saturnea]
MTETQSWTTDEVVRLAGVSSRTLRHYDQVGLLRPADTGPGGRRIYRRAELLRLQHVLVLRELGLGLPDIAAVLDGASETAALRAHHARLRSEIARLRRLARTVARSIEEREGGDAMSTEEMFAAFRNDPYAAEARERWGPEAVAVQEEIVTWDRDVTTEVGSEMAAVHRRLAALMAAGEPVDAPQVQQAVAAHHAWVSRFWTPGREAYTGLGRLYVDDARFTATIDGYAEGLSVYLRDAIAIHAQQLPE